MKKGILSKQEIGRFDPVSKIFCTLCLQRLSVGAPSSSFFLLTSIFCYLRDPNLLILFNSNTPAKTSKKVKLQIFLL